MMPITRETTEPVSVTVEYNKHGESDNEDPDEEDTLSTASNKQVVVIT